MARGRMISASLTTSAKIAALYEECPKLAEFCRCLFPLLVVNADDHGRLAGDEQTVKMKIDPITPRKLPDFVAALHLLASVGLIAWYQVDGRKIIEIIKFHEHQDLKGHDRRPPKLPACLSSIQLIGRFRGDLGELGEFWGKLGKNGDSTKENLTELNLTEPKGTELNRSGGESPPRQDENFLAFQAAYPAERRQGGYWAEQGFLLAVEKIDGGYPALASRLEQHKRSEQWLIQKRIPNMRKWFEDELWRQELPEPSTVGATPKTAGNKAALERFVARHERGV